MLWQDGSKLVYDHPRVDKNDYVAFVHAYSATNALLRKSPSHFSQRRCRPVCAALCGSHNGAASIDWHVRMNMMGQKVRELLIAQATATPPTPLRRPVATPEPYPVDALGMYWHRWSAP